MGQIDDKAYMECLPSDMYRRSYMRWKERMIPRVEAIVHRIDQVGVNQAMQDLDLSTRDVRLLTKLHYFTDAEIERFGLTYILSMDVI